MNFKETKEFYDIIAFFDNNQIPNNRGLRKDKEDKKLWSKGYVYSHGETNNIFNNFLAGYMLGRLEYMNS